MIMDLQNLHTHTTYCDGKLSPEDMLKAAIEKGCASIGFSGHSYTEFDTEYCMSREKTKLYSEEVTQLKKEYDGIIDVFLGIEQDYYSGEPTDIYDYVIGSVHYVEKNGGYIAIDGGAEHQKRMADVCYGGDYYAFAEDYFESAAKVYEKTGASIIGHFDLIAKYNEKDRLFNTSDTRYRKAAIEAMERILEKQNLFEVNTGAMYSRNHREPYPSMFLLTELQKRGGEVILTSDSHDADSICHKFYETAKMLYDCGFRRLKRLSRNGFADMPIV